MCSASLEHPCSTVNKFTPTQNSEFAAIPRDLAGKFEVDAAVRWGGRKPFCLFGFPNATFFKAAPGFQGGFTVDIQKKFEVVTGILWGEVVIRECE